LNEICKGFEENQKSGKGKGKGNQENRKRPSGTISAQLPIQPTAHPGVY
jgi:hypothetical protein